MRFALAPHRARWTAGLLLALAGCPSDGTVSPPPPPPAPPPPSPTIGVALNPAALTLNAGSNGAVTVTLTRGGGFTSSVDLTLENLPANVTGAFAPATIPSGSTSSALTVNTTAAATVGNSQLTIRARAAGVTDATAVLTLTVNPPPAGTFTLGITPNPVVVTQGQSANAAVNIVRNNFNGTVTLSLTGAVAGLTAAVDPPATNQTAATITVTAAANLAAGNYVLTLNGTGTGVAPVAQQFTVQVNQQPVGGNVAYSFACTGASLVPIWFGRQDGNGPWLPVAGSAGNQFVFNIASGQGGVAWVTGAGNQFVLTVHLGSTLELQQLGQNNCPSALAKTITGSVAGVGGTDLAFIGMGGASAVVAAAGGTGFTLNNVPDGLRDLIAARVTNAGGVAQLAKLIARRGLNEANGAVLPVLDFGSGEAFDPAQASVTINNIGAENARVSLGYVTSTSPFAILFSETNASANAARTWRGFPGARQSAGDLHALLVTSTPGGLPTPATQRIHLLHSRDVADRVITLGNLLNLPTVTTSLNVNYIRFQFEMAIQSEYNKTWVITFAQNQLAGSTRSSTMTVMPGYLASTANGAPFNVSLPDFHTGASGFNGFWGPLDDFLANWTLTGIGWNGANPVIEGGVITTGVRTGAVTP